MRQITFFIAFSQNPRGRFLLFEVPQYDGHIAQTRVLYIARTLIVVAGTLLGGNFRSAHNSIYMYVQKMYILQKVYVQSTNPTYELAIQGTFE